uniref:Uncharacterized protein n=1 Tax=Prolemur simus TaxID=1328070 RepID=A0A8C8YFD4_PROSS
MRKPCGPGRAGRVQDKSGLSTPALSSSAFLVCVAPPELETKENMTKGGLVWFLADANSSSRPELSKNLAVYRERSRVHEGKRCFHHPDCFKGCDHRRQGAPDDGTDFLCLFGCMGFGGQFL